MIAVCGGHMIQLRRSSLQLSRVLLLSVLISVRCLTQPQQGANPYFAPYLEPGELPDGATLPLFHEIWTVMGSGLTSLNFTTQVDLVSKGIFSQYSFQGNATGLDVALAAPTYLDDKPVDPQLLSGDDYSSRMLADYSSIDIHVNVTIDNKAWYPDLGYVARTNHNRLANKLQSEGFNVMAWVATEYVLEQPAIQILHRMPIQTYKSFLVELAVTGDNLIPMTVQKQNVVTAVIADVLTPNAVWFTHCIGVNQTSPALDSNTSTAVVSLVLEQDAEALYIGQALMNVINDTLGAPLFDVKTAAAGLPLSATISSISNYPGHSITDQVSERFQGSGGLARWKVAVSVLGGVFGTTFLVAAGVLLWRQQGQVPLQISRYKSHSLDQLLEMQGTTSSPSPVPLKLLPAKDHMRHSFDSALQAAMTALHLPGSQPRRRLLSLESAIVMEDDSAQSRAGVTYASSIDPTSVQICCHSNGEKWILGMGSYGVVYKAKMGNEEVAVKTVNRLHVTPQLTERDALRVMHKELEILEKLRYDDNIVQLHGHYIQDKGVALVLEYMEGGDLRQALGGPHHAALGWYRLGAQIALDIIKGVQFLHSHKIIHRDIKSGNVLLSRNFDSAKICDVGFAHVVGNTHLSSNNTQTTFAYAAPEMITDRRCDARADIYSLGVVLWELVTQEVPRRGGLRDVRVPEECPAAVNELLSACLDEADRRPPAQQIFDVIQACVLDNKSQRRG